MYPIVFFYHLDEKLYLQYHDENEKYLIFDITVFYDPKNPAGRFCIYDNYIHDSDDENNDEEFLDPLLSPAYPPTSPAY